MNRGDNESSESRAARPGAASLFLGLLAIFWLEYVRPGDYLPLINAVKLNTIVPLAVAAVTLFARSGRPNGQVLRATDTKWFLLILLLFFVQFFVADVRLYVYEVLKGFVGYLLIYYAIVRQVTTLRRIKVLMATMIAVHILIIALFPNVILDPAGRHPMAGTFLGDGNDFAWSVCIVTPFALFLAQASDNRIGKIVSYGLFGLLILAVIGTQSRGASLALLCSIIYLTMTSRRKLLALAGIGVIAAIVAAFAPPVYFDRLETIEDYETEQSAQGRILAWKTATNMALDHPLTGVGPGHYSVKFGFEYKPKGYIGPYLNTHSIYFTMLAEFGFPGLVVLLSIIIGNGLRNSAVIRKLRDSDSPEGVVKRSLMTAMQASWIGFLVAGAFLSGVFYPHLFVLTALMESARYIVLNDSARA